MSIVSLNKENFKELTLKGVSLVDFWAAWCGPCRMLNPIIEQVAEELSGQINVGKVNIDDAVELAKELNIASVPTIVIFKDAQEVDRMVGVNSKENIIEVIKKYI